MPPEIIKKEQYGKEVDIWSAGAVTFVLLTGKPPFIGKDKEEVYNAIINKELNLKIPDLFRCSKDAVDFLSKVLVKNPDERLTAKQALEHPWLLDANISQLDPNQDAGLQHVTHNLLEFSKANQFQKMVLSILSSFKGQQDELGYIKEQFLKLDTNLDGTLTADELKQGLSKL
jgi:calcium-dependent protein kinase